MSGELEVRRAVPEDAAAIARVQIDTWRSTYRGIVPDAYLDAMSTEDRTKGWEDLLSGRREMIDGVGGLDVKHSARTFVAFDKGELAGFCSVGPNRDRDSGPEFELYAIYIHPTRQKKGVGRRLFDAAVDHLKSVGAKSLVVWVLKANPSGLFYESMGARLDGQRLIDIGGASLDEVSYLWDTLPLREAPKSAKKRK